MKKFLSILALCAFFIALTPASNGQGLVIGQSKAMVNQNDPCPPCPPCPTIHQPIGRANHPRPTVIPRGQCGDVIVNVNCAGESRSCEPCYGTMDPPNCGSSSAIAYPIEDTNGAFISNNALFWWLLLITIAVAFLFGKLFEENRNRNQSNPVRHITNNYHGTVNHYNGDTHHHAAPIPPAPVPVSPASVTEKKMGEQ